MMIEVTQREKTKIFPVMTLLTVSHPQPRLPKLKFQRSRLQSNRGEYETVRAEDRPIVEEQFTSLKSKTPSVRLRKRERLKHQGHMGGSQAGRNRTGKLPMKKVEHI